MPRRSIERRLSHKSFSNERVGRQDKPAQKAANPPRGASVRNGHNPPRHDPTERATSQRRGLCGALAGVGV